MEIWAIGIVVVLALILVVLLGCLLSLRHAVREVAVELDEKMSTDTNTLISISSADPAVRLLAARMNVQLRALRDERRRLQNGDAELKAAVTNISHDLRTPLTAICGYLDLLEQEETSECVARYLAVVRERCDALQSLTEELFRYSVVTSASDEPALEPVSLNGALEVGLAAFYGSLTERGIAPEIHMPEGEVVRMLDPSALQRVFSNVLNNAVKYSDGDLTVTLSGDGTVTFANGARGLSAVQAEKLFDRFYTVASGRPSTGLGLSIAKLLTERMGGTAAAEVRDGRLIVSLGFPARDAPPRSAPGK